MSKIGKIAKCSGCGQEKPIFSELNDSRGDKRVYCENCVKNNHEKIKQGVAQSNKSKPYSPT